MSVKFPEEWREAFIEIAKGDRNIETKLLAQIAYNQVVEIARQAIGYYEQVKKEELQDKEEL